MDGTLLLLLLRIRRNYRERKRERERERRHLGISTCGKEWHLGEKKEELGEGMLGIGIRNDMGKRRYGRSFQHFFLE